MPAPKRPLTGYFRFMQEIRDEVERQTGQKGIKNAAIFSQRWKDLSDNEKSIYLDPAKTAYEKYRVKLTAYKKTAEYAEDMRAKQDEKLKKMKKPKDPNAPKRPLSGYFLFMQDVRPQIRKELGDKWSVTVQGKRVGKMWAGMSKEQKSSYEQRASKLKKAYLEELKAYKQTAAYAKHQEALSAFQEKKKRIVKARKKAAKKE